MDQVPYLKIQKNIFQLPLGFSFQVTNKKVMIASLVCSELSAQYNYIFQL